MAKNKKMVICRSCNASIAATCKKCPACGAKNKKPFYRRWWFVLLVIIVVLGVYRSIKSNIAEKILWEDIVLQEYLPKPEAPKGDILINDAEHLLVDLKKVTKEEKEAYQEECEKLGFVVNVRESEYNYDAYNEEGYLLGLWYNDNSEKLEISLRVPEKMDVIALPATGPGSLLPDPGSHTGRVLTDSSRTYSVRVGDISMEEYESYIEACEEAGFVEDYEKEETSYKALNEEGYQLKVSHGGFYTMEVTIKEPEKKEEPAQTKEEEEIKEEETDKVAQQETEESNKEPEEAPEENTAGAGIRPEFKEACDSYESFYREYVELLKKYAANPTDLTLLGQYTNMMQQAVKMSEDFEALDEGEMSNEEAIYYLEVTSRVMTMLLEVEDQ